MSEELHNPDDLLSALLAQKPQRHTTNGRHRMPLYDFVRAISSDIGWRPAGSTAEARAAEYLVRVWQQADVWHWVDSFPTALRTRPVVRAMAAASILCAGLVFVSLWAALICALIGTGIAYHTLTAERPPMPNATTQSQNVLAIRKSTRSTMRRVVLCAPLDTFPPPIRHGLPRTHLVVATIQLTMVILSILDPLPALFGAAAITLPIAWLAVLCTTYYLVMVVFDAIQRRPVRSAGAISHAGALAVLAGSFDEVMELPHTEVWAVAMGASAFEGGAIDLLQRYPFDPDSTFFIGLAGIGRGTLAYALPTGYDRGRPVDALLIEMASQLQTDTAIEPRLTHHLSFIRPFLRRQCRAIELTCLDHDGHVPLQGSPHDTAAAINPHILTRAVHIVVTMVRSIDALSLSPTQLHHKE
ncbi:MAG: hypothetical protein RLY87_1421 [Chloroflexota bacterium]|jgi:hypothetical protein